MEIEGNDYAGMGFSLQTRALAVAIFGVSLGRKRSMHDDEMGESFWWRVVLRFVATTIIALILML